MTVVVGVALGVTLGVTLGVALGVADGVVADGVGLALGVPRAELRGLTVWCGVAGGVWVAGGAGLVALSGSAG
ncbi:MAG: hypothetical protein ACLPKE_16585 [Streptosporangiaceae bacterium]